MLNTYIVVKPGKTWRDVIGFTGWGRNHVPRFSIEGCGITQAFSSRTQAEQIAKELGDGWIVWDQTNILREVEKTYGVKVVP